MRTPTHTFLVISLFLLQGISLTNYGQPGCKLKPPLLHIDFGRGENVPEFNATAHANYRRVKSICPDDGNYSYTARTSRCFNDDWFTLWNDHTGDGGNMMLVNASESGGSFFSSIITGLEEHTTYEFAVWLMNVCRIHGGCSPLPPNINVTLISFSGRVVAQFITGKLTQGYSPRWKKYSAQFTTAAGETMLGLNMANTTIGGCGNDFAMDDITVRECVAPALIVQKPVEEKPVKTAPEQAKETVVKTPARPKAIKPADPEPTVKRDADVVTVSNEKPELPELTKMPSVKVPQQATLPRVLRDRANPVIRTILVPAGEMQIDLYDNGQIDGDTVSIYHNNKLIVSKAGISQKPVSFKIKVDGQQPHHELVMVAENLGSIPPNTSLMIIQAMDKRYDVFISSSEQRNAKVVIDLKQ